MTDWGVYHSISLALRIRMEVHMFEWYIAPVFHSPSPGACYTQIRILPVGCLPSCPPEWTEVRGRAPLPGHHCCPSVGGQHCCASGCRLRGILLQGRLMHSQFSLKINSWPLQALKCMWYTSEQISGEPQRFHVLQILASISKEFKRSASMTTGNLPTVTGYCLKCSQAARNTMYLILLVKLFSVC